MSKRFFFVNFPRFPYTPKKSRKWILRPWVLLCCFTPAFIIIWVNTLENGSILNSFWHFLLAISIFISLVFLSDRPLLNPVQAFVFIVLGWFSVGPSIEVLWCIYSGDDGCLYLIERGIKTLWVICFGLPLYAVTSRFVLEVMEKMKLRLRFLQPFGTYLRPKTLFVFFLVGIIPTILFRLLSVQTTAPLGFVEVEQPSWIIHLINAITYCSEFGLVGIIWYVLSGKGEVPLLWRILGIFMIVYYEILAVSSGSKGALVTPFVYAIIVLMTKKQCPPFKVLSVFIIVFYFVILPFVTDLRRVAQSAHLVSSKEAENFAWDYIKYFKIEDGWGKNYFNPAIFFRGIYYYAGIVAERSDIFSGPWEGYTYKIGFAALIPRIIYPEKPDLNVGNFVARDLGVYDDYFANIGVSLPVEVWGNFGALASIISFPLFGIAWTFLCALILSPKRLHDHPIAPLFVLETFRTEATLAPFLSNTLKIYPFMFFSIWIIRKCFLRRL